MIKLVTQLAPLPVSESAPVVGREDDGGVIAEAVCKDRARMQGNSVARSLFLFIIFMSSSAMSSALLS
jgi:hypothetical protein